MEAHPEFLTMCCNCGAEQDHIRWAHGDLSQAYKEAIRQMTEQEWCKVEGRVRTRWQRKALAECTDAHGRKFYMFASKFQRKGVRAWPL